MLCLVARFGGEAIRYPLPRAQATLGSAADNEILVPFPGVSRVHAVVVRTDGGFILRDSGSKNRLYVGDSKVDEVSLHPGVVVQVGRAAVTIEEVSSAELELALETNARNSSGQPDTSEQPAGPSATRALQVVRELEMRGQKRIRRDLQGCLMMVKDAIGATCVMVLSIDGETESLVALSGVLPAESLIATIAAAVRRDRKKTACSTRVLQGRTLLAARGKSEKRFQCIVAAFSEAPDDIEPWQEDLFAFVARKIVDTDEASDEKIPPPMDLTFPDAMVVGESAAMSNLLDQIRATVRSNMDVLLWGETGTGKELFARMIHASGLTASGPFVAINCAAIPSELLESELFGVQARVATGVDPRPGLFAQADGGSIFLDEIGELAEPLQAKLLRVLQEREVLPLGAASPRKINVRVIASSNRNLLERSQEGKFRADLYYRLRGLQFHIPPLRERRDDIAGLVFALVTRFSEAHHRRIRGVSRKALQLLMEHEWPGNVRELQSEIERSVLVCPRGGVLHSEHFGPVRWAVDRRGTASVAAGDAVAAAPPSALSTATLQERLDLLEREAIETALAAARGNKTVAARILGITRNGLAMKMRRLR
jgi:DNA-binding NtrC family response regulator